MSFKYQQKFSYYYRFLLIKQFFFISLILQQNLFFSFVLVRIKLSGPIKEKRKTGQIHFLCRLEKVDWKVMTICCNFHLLSIRDYTKENNSNNNWCALSFILLNSMGICAFRNNITLFILESNFFFCQFFFYFFL